MSMPRLIVSCVIAVVVLSPLRLVADTVVYTIPFNADVVKEPGGTASGLGATGTAFVSQSYAAANDSVNPRGLPDNRMIGNVQLGPYNGSNATYVGPNNYVGVLLTPPGRSFYLHIYAAADDFNGNGFPHPSGNLKLWFNHSHFYEIGNVTVPNWNSAGGSNFIGGMDTTGAGGSGFINSNSAAIFDITTFVSNSDLGINNIGIQNFSVGLGAPTPGIYVFGIEAVTPEPGTVVSLALAAILLGRRRRQLRGFGG